MQVSTNKKPKKKLKKGFKISLITILIILVFIFGFLLFKKFNNNTDNIKTENNTQENSTSTSTNPVVIDNNPAANDEFSRLFKLRLPSQHLEYSSSNEISQNGDMKIYLKDTKDATGYIFVNTKDEANYVWITFASAIAGEPLKTLITNDLKNLNYIDMRFGNKIFYKFNDGNNSTTSTSTIVNTSSSTIKALR
ncbi:MAG: hypothetical protein WCO35_01575 [Candidatus Nomurabacteria bacterium]